MSYMYTVCVCVCLCVCVCVCKNVHITELLSSELGWSVHVIYQPVVDCLQVHLNHELPSHQLMC